jgi:hypothetical protein
MAQSTFCRLELTVGPDRDSEELIDAVGKKKTARECSYDSDYRENAVSGKRPAASEQSGHRGENHVPGQGVDRDFDER